MDLCSLRFVEVYVVLMDRSRIWRTLGSNAFIQVMTYSRRNRLLPLTLIAAGGGIRFCMFLYFQVSSVMWDVALTRSQAALDGCVALWPDYDGQQQIAVYSINPLSTKGSGQQL